MQINFLANSGVLSGSVGIFVSEGCVLPDEVKRLDDFLSGFITRALEVSGFKGGKDEFIDLILPGSLGIDRVIVFGIGKADELDATGIEYVGGRVSGYLLKVRVKSISLILSLSAEIDLSEQEQAARLSSGMKLRAYRFDKYKSFLKPEDEEELALCTILTSRPSESQALFKEYEAVVRGVHYARDLVNEPANKLYPESFVRELEKLRDFGVEVEVLSEDRMRELGMGALLGVGQGSVRRPYLCCLRWHGVDDGSAPLAFVGKGVTFDTGGISIKPASGMEDMKGDMGGAACVSGLILSLALRRAKINAVGVVGLVENMPDGNAIRPGDILTTMSGKTISVLNTDAEGRLVLADALWYTQETYSPRLMINLATLTGAILVALGKEHAGLFSNNDELSGQLFEAGRKTLERVWRLPLLPEYDKLIDSDIADMKNIGGLDAGSITAGQFLQRFVNKEVPWAHLDIAGTAMGAGKTPINPSWGSGWGVRLLNQLIKDNYESC